MSLSPTTRKREWTVGGRDGRRHGVVARPIAHYRHDEISTVADDRVVASGGVVTGLYPSRLLSQ